MPVEVSQAMKLLVRRRSQATVNPFVHRRQSHMRIEYPNRNKKFRNAALMALEIDRLNQAKQRLGMLSEASLTVEEQETDKIPHFNEDPTSSEMSKRRHRLLSFRRAARAILIVIRACNNVRDLLSNNVKSERWMLVMDNILLAASRNRGRRQAFTAKYTDNESHHVVEVSFDANKFRRDFVSDELFSGPTRIALERTPAARDTNQIRDIVRCMRSISVEFRRYPKDVQWRICEVAFFDKFAPNRVIIKQGLPPDGFYFVLMGTVAEHSPDHRIPRDHNVGSKFGEQDLVCGSHRRTTAVARTYVELLYIHRLDYGRIFNLTGASMENTDFSTCLRNPIFGQFPMNCFMENPGTWNVVPYKVGQLIADDSNRLDWIYVVQHGQARVLRSMETRSIEMTQLNDDKPMEDVTMKLLNFRTGLNATGAPQSFRRVQTAKSARSCPTIPPIKVNEFDDHLTSKERNIKCKFPVTSRRPKTSIVPLRSHRSPRAIQVPSFLQIEQLGPGQAFGLRACLEEEDRGPSASLVSAGCTMLLFNRRFFASHLDTFMLGMIRLYTKPYPTEAQLLKNLNTILKWEDYKDNTLRCSITRLNECKKIKAATGAVD